MRLRGDLGEWFKPAVLKTADGQPSVSSNLTVSATFQELRLYLQSCKPRMPGRVLFRAYYFPIVSRNQSAGCPQPLSYTTDWRGALRAQRSRCSMGSS